MALVIASSLPHHMGTDGQCHYWHVRERDDGRWQPLYGYGPRRSFEWREIGQPYRSRDDAIERAKRYARYVADKK